MTALAPLFGAPLFGALLCIPMACTSPSIVEHEARRGDASDADTPIAHQEAPPPSIDAASVPLDEIDALVADQRLDDARVALRALVEDGLDGLSEGLHEAERIEFGRRVEGLAEALVERKTLLLARRFVHARLEATRAPDDPALLRAKKGLAIAHIGVGEPAEARRYFEQVLVARREALSPEDPELLLAITNLAYCLEQLGEVDGAIRLHEEAVATFDRIARPTHRPALDAKETLANLLGRRGEVARSRDLMEEVHTALVEVAPDDDAMLLRVKQNLAARRLRTDDAQGALVLFEEVLEARRRAHAPSDPEVIEALQNLGAARFETGDVRGAHEVFRRVLEVRSEVLPPDHPDVLGAKMNLAASAHLLGELDEALALTEEALRGLEAVRPADDDDVLALKQNLASMRRAAGDLDGALALGREVLEVLTEALPRDHPYVVDAQESVAVSLFELGDLEPAAVLFSSVLDVRLGSLPEDHLVVLTAKQNMAGVAFARGETQAALRLSEEVLAGRERQLPADHPDLVLARFNVASLRLSSGDHAGARELLERLVGELGARFPADHPQLMRAKVSLANALNDDRENERALELLEEVQAGAEQRYPPEHPDRIRTTINLAATLRDLGYGERAQALSEQALAASREYLTAGHPATFMAANNVANGLASAGRLEEALELRRWVLDQVTAQRPRGHDDSLAARQGLAATLGKAGAWDGLHATLVALLDEQTELARSTVVEAPRVARSLAGRELGRLADAVVWSAQLDGSDRPSLRAELVTALESFRALSSVTAAASREARRSQDLRVAIERASRARRELARLAQTPPQRVDGAEAWRRELFELSEERDRHERAARRALEELGLCAELPTHASIAAALDAGTAYAGYWRCSIGASASGTVDHYAAYVIASDGAVEFVDLGRAALVDDAVDRWRRAVGAPLQARGLGLEGAGEENEDASLRAGGALRELILDPVLARAPDASAWLLVPDSALFLVPFDALPAQEGVVGDGLAIRVAASARAFADDLERPSAIEPALLVVGGPDYAHEPDAQAVVAAATTAFVATAAPPTDRASSGVLGASFAPLPGAAREVEAIARTFESSFDAAPVALGGASATKAAFLRHAEAARYVHVATHGWFAPEGATTSMLDAIDANDEGRRLLVERAQDTITGFLPETLCGLALAGANHGPEGVLTAEELATIDLTSCELAVLSACETNVGIRRAGQGIQSLQTALHAAGARTAITSLWKVDDAATRRLFEVFYTKLWQDGLGAADALWRAKMTLRDEGYAVRDWAGWVLTGADR